MRTITTWATLAVAAIMLVPSGVAIWSAYGSREPDTHYDASDGYMFPNAPTGTHAVYFNVYNAYDYLGQGPSPNTAILGSRMTTLGAGTFNALLGVWADCNHDGYIGLVQGALEEYRAEASAAAGFAVDTTLCPPTPDTVENKGAIHNNGGWITELIPIAPLDDENLTKDSNYRILQDSTVAMWGDKLEPITPTGGPIDGCVQATAVPPFGYQQTRGPGGVLRQIDCDESIFAPSTRTIYNLAIGADPTGALGIVPEPRSLYTQGGPLDVDVFGTEERCKGPDGGSNPCPGGSNSIVSGEQDCTQAPLVDLGAADPAYQLLFSGSLSGHGIRAPGRLQLNPSGTIPATTNETTEESALDDCNANDDFGHDFYGNGIYESSSPYGIDANRRASSQMSFSFQAAHRGRCAPSTVWENFGTILRDDPIPNDPSIVPPTRCGEPGSEGAPAITTAYTAMNQWTLDIPYISNRPNPGFASASDGRASIDLFPGSWLTFYVRTGAIGVELPHTGDGIYGAEWCTAGIGAGASVQHGWDCDPNHWNLDPSTGTKVSDAAHFGTVGEAYQLRDVDCYDWTVVSRTSPANPTGADLGARSVPGTTDPAHACSFGL